MNKRSVYRFDLNFLTSVQIEKVNKRSVYRFYLNFLKVQIEKVNKRSVYPKLPYISTDRESE